MMGVTFAAVAPMVAMANANPGVAGAGAIFGAIIGAGVISIAIAPMVSRILRFFPPVVTGIIILIIGISLMRVGINWIFGNPVGPTAPSVVNPEYAKWLEEAAKTAGAPGSAIPAVPKGMAIAPNVPNPKYADLTGVGIAALVLVSILLITRFAKGFVAGGVVLLLLGLLPEMAALVESLPTVVLGRAGLMMFGMVAATGIRILAGVDFKHNRFNAMIVAISVGIGMIPLIAPNFKQWMPHGVHPLIESGILLSSIAAVLLNLFYNGAREDTAATIAAAKQAGAH